MVIRAAGGWVLMARPVLNPLWASISEPCYDHNVLGVLHIAWVGWGGCQRGTTKVRLRADRGLMMTVMGICYHLSLSS